MTAPLTPDQARMAKLEILLAGNDDALRLAAESLEATGGAAAAEIVAAIGMLRTLNKLMLAGPDAGRRPAAGALQ